MKFDFDRCRCCWKKQADGLFWPVKQWEIFWNVCLFAYLYVCMFGARCFIIVVFFSAVSVIIFMNGFIVEHRFSLSLLFIFQNVVVMEKETMRINVLFTYHTKASTNETCALRIED